jgi:hypothetical protein
MESVQELGPAPVMKKVKNSLTLNYSLITYYNIDSIGQNTFDTMIATTASDNVNEGITTDVPEVRIDQGNLLKDIVIWFVRREGIEPIKSVFSYVLFSVTHFL